MTNISARIYNRLYYYWILEFFSSKMQALTWDHWTAEIQSRPSRSLTDVIHQYSDHLKNGSSARIVAWSNKTVSDFFLGTTFTSLKNPSKLHNTTFDYMGHSHNFPWTVLLGLIFHRLLSQSFCLQNTFYLALEIIRNKVATLYEVFDCLTSYNSVIYY